nr:hypothetical protein [Tanacetum cinerariifolium]
MIQPEPKGSTQGYLLVSVEVLRYDKRSKHENVGIVPTEMELILEHTQQGISHEVLIKFSITIGETVTYWFTLIVLSALRRSDNENMSILTDLQVTPTKPRRMTKPYSAQRFIANYFNAGNLKMEVKGKITWQDSAQCQRGKEMLCGSGIKFYCSKLKERADDLDACDSDCDEISAANAVLRANLPSYGSDVLSEDLKELTCILCPLGILWRLLLYVSCQATKTTSWLWHRHLSYLNFGAINHLARNSLVCDLPKLKFEKDHLCSVCTMGKRKKQSHKPKSKDTNQEKLYLLHMDLCGPMRVASVNGKKYILIILDGYSWFTWVKFLTSKDEAPDFHQVGISYETSVTRTPQQNGIVERRNHTLIEAA